MGIKIDGNEIFMQCSSDVSVDWAKGCVEKFKGLEIYMAYCDLSYQRYGTFKVNEAGIIENEYDIDGEYDIDSDEEEIITGELRDFLYSNGLMFQF